MKNINKILGIVLAVAMLAGLMMMAVPVSAGSLSWSTMTQPKVTAGTSANMYTIAADGKTMYLFSNNTDKTLYKSTDAGITWSSSGLDSRMVLDNSTYPVTQLAVSQFDATQLIAVANNTLYRSTNSGQTWASYSPSGVGTIKSVDISAGANGGVCYLVGADNGVYLYDSDALGNWEKISSHPGFSGTNALAVGFSPNYASDTAVVAVVSDGNPGTNLYVETFMTNGDPSISTEGWGSTSGSVATAEIDGVTTNHAALAFPSSNYDPLSSSNNRVWVGTDSEVYYVNCKSSGTPTVHILGDYQVWSLAYKGSPSSGTLAVGQTNDPNVPTTTDITTTSATFVDSSNEVTGSIRVLLTPWLNSPPPPKPCMPGRMPVEAPITLNWQSAPITAALPVLPLSR